MKKPVKNNKLTANRKSSKNPPINKKLNTKKSADKISLGTKKSVKPIKTQKKLVDQNKSKRTKEPITLKKITKTLIKATTKKPKVKVITKAPIKKPGVNKEKTLLLKSSSAKTLLVKKRAEKVILPKISMEKVDNSREDDEYMNSRQLDHFKSILFKWKSQIMEEVDNTKHNLQKGVVNYPDPIDRANYEEEFSLELRTRDRERKLIYKINDALNRINDGDYGYCDACGAEIGAKRLEARPTATQCIECKKIAEIKEKQSGESNL